MSNSKPPIILVQGGKGGVGKSMICHALIDYFLQKDNEVAAVETDMTNPGFYNTCKGAEGIVLGAARLTVENGWYDLQDFAYANKDKAIIVNTAAQNLEFVEQYGYFLRDALNGLEGEDEATGHRLCTIWALHRNKDSAEVLSAYLKMAGKPERTHVLRNLAYGPADSFNVYNNSALHKQITLAGGKTLNFPRLGERVYDILDQQRLTIAQTYEKVSYSERMELARFRRATRRVFSEILDDADIS